ncbi:unnamed protein product [Brachionus calyciflorus]|uniref:Uncharacterized protein n=1 Tax=Brachionus calyciflorus TaxID=104777 RepID=A0A813MFP9_9BILA|nr:unnamed protein product [Brachionus calyciflorus]
MEKLNDFNITSKTHLDKVFVYTGQNYGNNEAYALKTLNDLSRNNNLTLCKRQISCKRVKLNLKQNENQNYEAFVNNFNKTALACYLKVLGASDRLWSAYSLDNTVKLGTNFRILNSKNDQEIEQNLQDENFIKNYLIQVIKVHNQIVKKLNVALNLKKNVHFCFDDLGDKNLDKHLYRSFRVLGQRKSSKMLNNNFKSQFDFDEIVDIRASFSIDKSSNGNNYEHFIECEVSYYRVECLERKRLSCKYNITIDDLVLNGNKKSSKLSYQNKQSASQSFRISKNENNITLNI